MNNYNNVKKDIAGWPEGLSDESKQWLTDKVAALLKQRPMELWEVAHHIRYADQPADLKKWIMLDTIYCAIDRACREVAVPMWTLK